MLHNQLLRLLFTAENVLNFVAQTVVIAAKMEHIGLKENFFF